MTPPLVLTVDQAAETLHCSRRRVFELLADGTLTRAQRFGRQTVIIAESVFAALEAEYHPPAPPKKRIRSKRGLSAALDDVLARARAR